ncbi:hypothetical protein [Methylomicrobium agile]|jgi:hypothetical protein|uniref:hypothetical protein n=1 Tax=Methylomicrobium agile TaxID=39774 RepID=UPI001C034E3C|nr:hypothetical protein [Methylomicrobium agile]
MYQLPGWLPPMFEMSPWSEALMESLYALFKRDFIDNPANYSGYPIWFFPQKDRDKEEIFWHLVEREDPPKSGNRFPDFRRSERLPWARPMLNNLPEPEVLHWDYEEGNKDIRTYVWLKDHDYLIVMKKYKNGQRRLITAYYVNYDNARIKLLKKYENRIL